MHVLQFYVKYGVFWAYCRSTALISESVDIRSMEDMLCMILVQQSVLLPVLGMFLSHFDSVKVFSSLVPALLANNLRIEVWEQKPGFNTRWTKRLSASPGNVEAIMADMSSGAIFRLMLRRC